MNRVKSRIALLQAVMVALLLAIPAVAGGYIWSKHRWAQDQLVQLEPRFARLSGLQKAKDSLAQAEESAKALLASQAYSSSQDAVQAGNDAQQRVRTLFADSKLEIGSIQVLPAKEQQAFDRIGIALRVEGDLVGLQNAMALLEKQSPAVWVESMSIQTVGVVKPKSTQRLAAQVNLFVLRVRS